MVRIGPKRWVNPDNILLVEEGPSGDMEITMVNGLVVPVPDMKSFQLIHRLDGEMHSNVFDN
jgi:hypothetical protein